MHFGGADFEALTYRVAFGEAGADGSQSLRLYTLAGADAREGSAAGELVLEGRTGQAASAGGIRIWAGRTQDSFYIDLSLLSIVNGAIAKGTAVDLSQWRPDKAKNSFAGTSVESIVLEVSTGTRSCGRVRGSASGPPRNSPRTPAAGARSTGAGTR